MGTNSISPLGFDIDSVDEFMPGAGDNGVPEHSWSTAISGPDGSGKSILAMHAVAAYWRRAKARRRRTGRPPLCIYVSTDLSHDQAEVTWKAFGLHRPDLRLCTLRNAYRPTIGATAPPAAGDAELGLVRVKPQLDRHKKGDPAPDAANDSRDLSWLLSESTRTARESSVIFIDLQQESAGDDWGFLNHLLGMLQSPAEVGGRGMEPLPHLLVIDAIEGLTVMSGNRDAFGVARSRRSRIAQLVRSARRRNTAHLVLVVEEARPNRRLPEQFVTDAVIRLRQHEEQGYLVRSMEIEKCRGRSHVRGRHQFVLRSGAGAKTGIVPHVDEPNIDHMDQLEMGTEPNAAAGSPFLAHVHVIESLHNWNAKIRRLREDLFAVGSESPKFGLPNLDEILGDSARGRQPAGSLTLLLGEAGTLKSRLARTFLAQALSGHEGLDGYGACIYISTNLLDRKQFVEAAQEINEGRIPAPGVVEQLVLCRRLGIRYESGAEIIAAVYAYICAARRQLYPYYSDTEKRRFLRVFNRDGSAKPHHELVAKGRFTSRIRLVIDDLSLFIAAHPNIRADSAFLQSLLFLLKQEQVTALIVSTQPVQPASALVPPHVPDLRSLDERQILTWSVPFFGERRIAITPVTSGARKSANRIYELCPAKNKAGKPCGERVSIEAHFSLYSGLEAGVPVRVPLQVRLFTGFHDADTPEESAGQYASTVRHVVGQVFPHDGGDEVVQFEPMRSYDKYAAFANWMDDSRLGHTLILQVDEFWSPATGERRFMELNDYWDQPIDRTHDDLYRQFTPHEDRRKPRKLGKPREEALPKCLEITSREGYPQADETGPSRRRFFIRPHPREDESSDRYRIPYLWDFGFLLGRREQWYRSMHDELLDFQHTDDMIGFDETHVGEVWNALVIDKSQILHGVGTFRGRVSWQLFFQACTLVARRCQTVPFHVDTKTAESLLSLVFEVWASIDLEVAAMATSKGTGRARRQGRAYTGWFDELAASGKSRRPWTLRDLLRFYLPTLYIAMNELATACPHFRSVRRIITSKQECGEAAAERHWYSTASVAMQETKGPLSVLRMPGSVSTRGDWYLSVAAGSRSDLLARRVLDVLNSRQMGLLRLHSGVGLPTRDVVPDSQIGNALTALYTQDVDTSAKRALTYSQLCQAAPDWEASESNGKLKCFHRSWFVDYDRDTFFLRRFVARLFEQLDDWCEPSATGQSWWDAWSAVLVEHACRSRTLNPQEYPSRFEQSLARANQTEKYTKFKETADLVIGAMVREPQTHPHRANSH